MASNNSINSNNLTNHGVLVGTANSALGSITAGTTGQTLMGATSANPSFTGSPSFSGSVTAATGLTLTAGNFQMPTTTASLTNGRLRWSGSNNIQFDGNSNLFVSLSSQSGNYTTSGSLNILIGRGTATSLTSGNFNLLLGDMPTMPLTSGSSNIILSVGGGPTGITTGSSNILIGGGAGGNYTSSESGNIILGTSSGAAAESNVTRIGNIYGTTVGDAPQVVFIDVDNKLGSTDTPTFTGVASALQLNATGDSGGTASQTALTNATNTTQGAGSRTILSTGAGSGTNAGFIKIYVGTTTAYLPYFTTI